MSPAHVIAVAMLVLVATARAAPAPTPGLFAQADIFIGYEPEAVILRAQVQRRSTYHRDPQSLLFDRAHVQGGLVADVSPAFTLIGADVEWLPLQILRLRLQYDAYIYHGYIGLLRFGATDDDWSERTRRDHDDASFALGHNLRATAELRLRLWRFVAVSQAQMNLYIFDQQQPYVFEQFYGLLIARTDGILINRALLLFEFLEGSEANGGGETLRIGVFHSVRLAVDSGARNQRVGLALIWEPARAWWILDRPHALLLFGFHVEDRFVQGQPTFLAGFGSSFDLQTEP